MIAFTDIQKPCLAACDALQDDSELTRLVEEYAGPLCLSIEFLNDSFIEGKRVLEYHVKTLVYNGRWDYDDSTKYRDTDELDTTVSVEVDSFMPLEVIAIKVAAEVRGIENNRWG